jgi:hypothetical protein
MVKIPFFIIEEAESAGIQGSDTRIRDLHSKALESIFFVSCGRGKLPAPLKGAKL